VMMYQMNKVGYGIPSPWYYNVIREGYGHWKLPVNRLEKARDDTVELILSKPLPRPEPVKVKTVDDEWDDEDDEWDGDEPAGWHEYESLSEDDEDEDNDPFDDDEWPEPRIAAKGS
jgi:hypothetical protein